MSMSIADESQIVDAKGQPLLKGAIVEMSSSDGNWSGHQGIVVEPHSDIEGPEYSVAVFFNREVPDHEFNHWSRINKERGIMSCTEWDVRYGGVCRNSEMDFLWKDDVWKRCPRVIFFKPDELVVVAGWKNAALVVRLFKGHYHSVFSFCDGFPQPDTCFCFFRSCQAPATRLAFGNVWGSVFPLYTCVTHFRDLNGVCADELPIKKQALLLDGTPAMKSK